jgi:hypothetical protein
MTNQPSTDQILDTPGPWATPHMQAEGYGSSRVLAQWVSENLPAPGVTYCVRTRGSDPIDAGATAEAILELAPTEAQVISLDNCRHAARWPTYPDQPAPWPSGFVPTPRTPGPS